MTALAAVPTPAGNRVPPDRLIEAVDAAGVDARTFGFRK